MKQIAIGVNEDLIPFLMSYMSKEQAIQVAKKLTIRAYEIRQEMKQSLIVELKAMCKPDFGIPGKEILPANTIGLLDEKYDYSKILQTPIEEIDFITTEGII